MVSNMFNSVQLCLHEQNYVTSPPPCEPPQSASRESKALKLVLIASPDWLSEKNASIDFPSVSETKKRYSPVNARATRGRKVHPAMALLLCVFLHARHSRVTSLPRLSEILLDIREGLFKIRWKLQKSIKSVLEVSWKGCYNVSSRASWKVLETDATP